MQLISSQLGGWHGRTIACMLLGVVLTSSAFSAEPTLLRNAAYVVEVLPDGGVTVLFRPRFVAWHQP